MANHVSSLKRARQTVTRTEVNRSNRSRMRTSLRALREALTKGDVKAAQEQYRFPLQEPPECAAEGAGSGQGVAGRGRLAGKDR
jgi:ribosomal protein S20